MKKVIVVQLATLVCFWLLFFALQNQKVYECSLGLETKNWQNVDGQPTLVEKPYTKLTSESCVQWDAVHYNRIKSHGYSYKIEQAKGDYIFAFSLCSPTYGGLHTFRLLALRC